MPSSIRSESGTKSGNSHYFLTTNPAEIRTRNRRRKFEKFRRTKRYKDRVKELNAGQSCTICKTAEGLTRHHTRESDYKNEEIYYKALDWAVPICNPCHRRYHKGKTKVCPECGKVLIPPNAERCWDCIPDEEKERIEINKIRRKKFLKKIRHDGYERAKKWRKEHGKDSIERTVHGVGKRP